MSKYTTELRFICEKAAGYDNSASYNFVDETVTKAAPVIFDFDFPMFDESYRLPLERKILKHYYTREISAETVGLWKLWLNTRLNEIMPFYNKLYETELIKFNPLYDIDLTRDHNTIFNGRADGSRDQDTTDNVEESKNITTDHTSDLDQTGTNGESVTNNGQTVTEASIDEDSLNWNYYNDTPQGGVNGLESLTYLTNATKDTGEKTTTNDSETTTTDTQRTDAATTNNVDVEENTTTEEETNAQRTSHLNESTLNKVLNTEDYLEHVAGKSGGVSYSKLLMEFRDTFLNIDLQIINNLSDLFINLW